MNFATHETTSPFNSACLHLDSFSPGDWDPQHCDVGRQMLERVQPFLYIPLISPDQYVLAH